MPLNPVARIMRATAIAATLSAAGTLGIVGTASAADSGDKPQIDVLNWWTSGSEAKSMRVLQQMLGDKGVKMNNDAVSGGGGSNARTVLKSRIQSHNTPGVAQIKGPKIQQWCETGLIGSMDKAAKSDNWDEHVAPRIAKSLQCDGEYVAVPFNVHRINWLWVNRSLLKEVDAEMPQTWSQFVGVLKKLKKADITPIAGGGNTWQVGTAFDALVGTVGDAKFYRKALIKLDQDALSSDKMVQAFKRLRTIQKYTDPNAAGLSWNHNTGMVVQGKAAMQIMGDWAKGEITNDGKTPGEEIACVTMPGNKNSYIYNVDTFEAFTVDSKSRQKAQAVFANTVMSPAFQRKFNMAKGSIPVREGTSLKGFDLCAKRSAQLYKKAKKADALVPSMSQDMAEVGAVKGAIFDVIAKFYNTKDMTAQDAAETLASRVKQAKQMSQL
ncbi:ABC transporter substrate-binding protein [Salinisphaera orenii]|uniref:ABC transporter substrate-binding protein n=1 Tax=Salinisphaera orenii TaxID=856731 RepID=UPI000DBE716C